MMSKDSVFRPANESPSMEREGAVENSDLLTIVDRVFDNQGEASVLQDAQALTQSIFESVVVCIQKRLNLSAVMIAISCTTAEMRLTRYP